MLDKNKVLLRKLKEKYKDEKVYVIPANLVLNIQNRFSHVKKYRNYRNLLSLIEYKGLFIPRYQAEYNIAMQQIIPYTIVLNDKGQFYISERIGGDCRLEKTLSIGFGGHINPIDLSNISKENNFSLLNCAADRELNEELSIKNIIKPKKVLGFVRDLSSNTAEHLGVIYIITVKEKVTIKEKDKLKGSWMSMEQLINKYYSFESWSRFLIDYLFTRYKDEKEYNE